MSDNELPEPFEEPGVIGCDCCCEDDCTCLIGWPYTNTKGNCWCGHKMEDHAVNVHNNCYTCQCVDFTLDTWATYA